MLKPEALVRAVKAADANVLHGEKGHESDAVTGAGETRNGLESGTHLRGSKKSIDLEVEIRNLEGNLSVPRTTIRSCLALGNFEGERVRVVKNQGKIHNGLLSMEAALVAMENHNLEVHELGSLQEGWGNLLSSGSSVARQCTFSSLSRAGYKLAPYKPREHFTSQPMQMDTDIDVGAAEILYGVALNSPVWWIEEMLLDLVDDIHGEGGDWLGESNLAVLEKRESGPKRDRDLHKHQKISAKRVKLESNPSDAQQVPDEKGGPTAEPVNEVKHVKEEPANIFINPFHGAADSIGGNRVSSENARIVIGTSSCLQNLRQSSENVAVQICSQEAAECNEISRKDAQARAQVALDNMRNQEKQVQERKKSGVVAKPKDSEFRCEICAITLNSATVLRQHFLGKRHLKAVARQIPRLERKEKEAEEGIIEVPIELVEEDNVLPTAEAPTLPLPSKDKLLSMLPDMSSTPTLVIVNRPDSSLIPSQTWPVKRSSAFIEVKKNETEQGESLRQEVWEDNSAGLQVQDEDDEVVCMEEEDIVCIATIKENPTGARPFRGFWPGSKVSVPLAVKKGELDRRYNFGHHSKPVMSAQRGRATSRVGGSLRGVCRGVAGEAKGRGQFGGGQRQFDGERGCGRNRPGRGRAALRELVGTDSSSNFPSLTNSRNNSDDKASPSSPADPISNTSVSVTAKAVETIVVDLSSDSEASSPSSRSSSPSSSWTTSPSPDEEQDDMMVCLFCLMALS